MNGIILWHIGVWRSLVSRMVRVHEAAGSNPATPTTSLQELLAATLFYSLQECTLMINVLLMSYDFDAQWAKETLRPYLNADSRVVILTMSHGDEIPDGETWERLYLPGGEIYNIFQRAYGAYGVPEESIEYVSWYHDTPESANEKLKRANVVFMTGGLPDLFLERMQELRLVEPLRNFDGLMMGCSAGAMIQMTEYHITPDEDYDSYGYYDGLGILDGFEPEVHYCASSVQMEAITLYQMERGKRIYAISNEGGLLVKNGEILCFGDVEIFPGAGE